MKYYYYLMLIVAGIVAIYGFIAPFLISYPSDLLSTTGFIIAIGAVPVFFKLIYSVFKQIVNK